MVDINIKNIDEKDWEKITKAAELEKRSKSNFILKASLEKANETILLKEE